jgi:hypothetical protein
MVDWFVLLTPVALLPIFWLLGFVGCELDTEGEASPVKEVETVTKPVQLSWNNPLGNTTSIAFSCLVHELSDTGLPTGQVFPGIALPEVAWPDSFLPKSGKTSAPVKVETPPAIQYQIDGTAEVVWGEASSSQKETLLFTKGYFGGFESQSWEFFLAHGPEGWSLT